jgi:methionyl-tRNA synthetase
VHKNGYMIEKTTGARSRRRPGAPCPTATSRAPARSAATTAPAATSATTAATSSTGRPDQPAQPDQRRDARFVETEHFFLDLPALAETLGAWLQPARSPTGARTCLKFSLNLLDDVAPGAMTATSTGASRCRCPGWEDNPEQRLYVWFDAVIGYLSASVEWARRSGDPDAWRAWWNDPEALSYYFMGKDNITFHSQIWPAELLAYSGRGSRAATARYGDLQLPTEVVSTIPHDGGRKFSPRSRVVLRARHAGRYQPDALRYFIAVAGPENGQPTSPGRVRARAPTTSSSPAGQPGQPHALIDPQELRRRPAPPAPRRRRALLAPPRRFGSVGDLLGTHRQKQAVGEAMRVVGEANKYLSDQAPWKVRTGDPDRFATIMHVATQAISDCRTLLSPFLPHSAQAVHEAFGGTGTVSPMPRIDEVDDLDGGPGVPGAAGDYRRGETLPAWGRTPIVPGTPLPAPSPVFRKLDDAVVAQELARARGRR